MKGNFAEQKSYGFSNFLKFETRPEKNINTTRYVDLQFFTSRSVFLFDEDDADFFVFKFLHTYTVYSLCITIYIYIWRESLQNKSLMGLKL